MRALLIFAIAMISLKISGQDSLKKFRLSGIQLKGNLLGSSYHQSTREEYLRFIKNNEVLNRDITGYTGGEQFESRSYNSYFALNLTGDLKTGSKFPNLELSAGVVFGQNVTSSSYYFKTTYDTVGVYYNSAKKDTIRVVDVSENTYTYRIQSQQLLVPLSINLTTNKSRRLWFTAGVELSPGLIFSNVFTAQEGLMKSEIYLKTNSDLKDVRTYARGDINSGQWYSTDTKLKGTGFVAYATLPLSANLRLSKKINFLKHISLSVGLSPGFYYSKSKFSGVSNGLVLNSSLGLRYNW